MKPFNIILSSHPAYDLKAVAAGLLKSNQFELIVDPTKALVQSYGFQTLYDMPVDVQKKLRMQLLHEHAASLLVASGRIYDHSVFAWLADWMRWLWSNTPTEEWDDVLSLARKIVANYDRVIVVASAPLKPYDGFVWRDQRNIEQTSALLSLLHGLLGAKTEAYCE